jgi:hypothetical protein
VKCQGINYCGQIIKTINEKVFKQSSWAINLIFNDLRLEGSSQLEKKGLILGILFSKIIFMESKKWEILVIRHLQKNNQDLMGERRDQWILFSKTIFAQSQLIHKIWLSEYYKENNQDD